MPVIILFDPCYELFNDVKRLNHGQKIRFDVLSARNVYASIFFKEGCFRCIDIMIHRVTFATSTS